MAWSVIIHGSSHSVTPRPTKASGSVIASGSSSHSQSIHASASAAQPNRHVVHGAPATAVPAATAMAAHSM